MIQFTPCVSCLFRRWDKYCHEDSPLKSICRHKLGWRTNMALSRRHFVHLRTLMLLSKQWLALSNKVNQHVFWLHNRNFTIRELSVKHYPQRYWLERLGTNNRAPILAGTALISSITVPFKVPWNFEQCHFSTQHFVRISSWINQPRCWWANSVSSV